MFLPLQAYEPGEYSFVLEGKETVSVCLQRHNWSSPGEIVAEIVVEVPEGKGWKHQFGVGIPGGEIKDPWGAVAEASGFLDHVIGADKVRISVRLHTTLTTQADVSWL